MAPSHNTLGSPVNPMMTTFLHILPSSLLMKILNKIQPNISPYGSPLDTALCLDTSLVIMALLSTVLQPTFSPCDNAQIPANLA